MSANVQLKTKFLLPISILILAFLMLTTSLITTYYTKANSLENLSKNVILATKISQLVHSTQKERGYSSGYVTSDGREFTKELRIQRDITDKRVDILRYLFASSDYVNITSLKKALKFTQLLQERRESVDSLLLTNTEVLKFYSDMNENYLDVIIELSKYSKIPKITQNLIAYSNFLYAKENSGRERALGTSILTQNFITPKQRVHFTNVINSQELYLKIFLKYVSLDGKKFYMQNIGSENFKALNSTRDILLTDTKDFHVEPLVWFHSVTVKIDKLSLVDIFLEKEILVNINSELDKTYTFFTFFSLLNLLGVIIFVSIIVLILKLIKSEHRLKKISDKYIISSLTDVEGRIIEVSDAFCEMSQYTREELLGKSHSIVRHPDMLKSTFKDLWQTIQSGKHWQGKVKNLKKDGGYYWVYANIEPLFDRKGNIEAYAAVRLDITDSVQLREEMQKGQEKDRAMLQQSKLAQMGEMIAMIAHQWRQPLTAISSISSDLYMKIMLDNCEEKYFNEKLEKIDELSQHLSKTIDDFRGFYKEDKEKVEIKFSVMVEGALNIVAPSMETKNIEIQTDFNCKEKINTYPNELRQVILNFIKNAEDILLEKDIKDACIMIQTYDKENFSYLEISDNAGGVAEEIIDKIFDPYFSTKTQKDGTGLGLYMSKTIVQEHCGGKLSVFNNEKGAVFQIKIPLRQEM